MNDVVQQHIPFMNAADAGVLIVLLAAAFLGWRRGLSGEFARLAGSVCAVVAAFAAYRPVGAWLQAHTRLPTDNAGAMAFIGTAIAALAVAMAVRLLVGSLMQLVFAESINKRLAIVAGLAHGVALTLLVFVSMNLVPHEGLNRFFGETSFTGRQVRRWVPIVRERWGDGPAWTPDGALDPVPVIEEELPAAPEP